MPKPVYIICAEGVTEDKRTNLLSFFNIVEKLIAEPLSEKGEKPSKSPIFQLRTVAVWMREESDPVDQEFEAQLQLIMPPNDEIVTAPNISRFRFKEGSFLVRITLQFMGDPPIKGAGVLRVVCLVRPVGSEEWQRQEYPIIVQIKEAKPQEEHAEATKKGKGQDANDRG